LETERNRRIETDFFVVVDAISNIHVLMSEARMNAARAGDRRQHTFMLLIAATIANMSLRRAGVRSSRAAASESVCRSPRNRVADGRQHRRQGPSLTPVPDGTFLTLTYLIYAGTREIAHGTAIFEARWNVRASADPAGRPEGRPLRLCSAGRPSRV
jgi:hypothetical protein